MIGKTWLLAFVAAGLVAAAPAAAQVNSTNPFALPRAQRFEHGHPGQHQAWRTERHGGRMAWKGRYLERRGERFERRGERFERRGRWLRRHGHPAMGRRFAREGHRWERRGDRLEHRGRRWDRRSGRLRHGGRQERGHRWHDGSI